MPKLSCPCGFVHDLSPIPDDGWRTVRDRACERLIDDEIASRRGDRVAMARAIGFWGLLYECPTCGRVMWQKPGTEVFLVYQRENPPSECDPHA